MNKAVPWNVNGVGFDAREAAREAARRQGKSVGEWLHGVIADHAADLGVEEHEIAGQQRIDAVTSKLERLSARSTEHDRRMRAGRDEDFKPRRPRDRDEDIEDRDEPPRRSKSFRDEPRRRRETSGIETTELLLEEAIDAMERRAIRAERQTDNALQSFSKLLERNEANRDRERDSVSTLAQKLSDIEARLVDRLGTPEENPIKGALARLEARLDTIGRRGAAESQAKSLMTQGPSVPAEPFQRLEEKLNSIFDALHTRAPQAQSEASPIALAASQAGPAKERRLGDAIAEISKRQQTLQGGDAEPISLQQAIVRRRGPVIAAAPRPEVIAETVAPFAAMQSEISALASTIENLRRDVAVQRANHPQPTVDFDALRAEIATMSGTLRELGPRRTTLDPENNGFETGGKISAVTRGVEEPRAIARIEDQMQEIRALVAETSQKIDRAVETPRAAPPPPVQAAASESAGLEILVKDLSRKIEAIQAPGADHTALDALQDQVALLSARFERSDEGLSKLTSLERSMRDLFTHLDETRASVETSAARAAREVLRIAMEEGQAQSDEGAATSLATIRALQDQAEARTSSTLSAVHGTLEKVVNRLSAMESDIAEARNRPPARLPDVRSKEVFSKDISAREVRSPDIRSPDMRPQEVRAPELVLGKREKPTSAPDTFLNQALGFRPGEKESKAPAASTRGAQTPSLDLDGENGRADFIAAARRAAKVAQSDPSVAELNRPKGTKTSPVRSGLIEQSRDYVTRHKRPVLLSIAALFVVLGTMAIMQKIGLDEGDTRTADIAAPTQMASNIMHAPRPRPMRQNDELSPSALPTSTPVLANPIPGSDPIQTGSIPSLPSFAAGAAPRPRPGLSNSIKTLAESGDGAAEYMLGAQYAEGNVVARDFSLAAKWYEKAAAQNLAPAQYRLASLYEKGLGVTQDKTRAKTLYLQAAEAGNPRAMHNLAVLLADGDGKPDYDGAATWFRKAAQFGIHDSQYNLAILLARGIGVQQSFVQSYQWFAIAAAQGDADAAKKRDEVGAKLGSNDLAVAKALASSFRPRIADVVATEVLPPST